MRILLVLRAPTGGLWRNAVDLAEALSRRKHAVGLAIDKNFSDAQTERGLAWLDGKLSLGVHRLPIARQPGLGDISAAWSVRQLAKKLDVDIIHGHGAKGGVYARLAALGIKKTRASVYTPHGGVLNYKVDQFGGNVLRGVETLMLWMNDAIVFESDFARRTYYAKIGKPRCHWKVIHNGLGPDDFAPLPETSEHFDFGFVGELRDVKGVDILLEALSPLKRPGGAPATLVLAGGGPKENDYRNYADQLGITDRVFFIGIQPSRDVFAQSNCVVIPSLRESLPYVILEAAATGRQVITTDVGGISEIFGPYADQLIAASDVEALRSAMKCCLENPEKAKARGADLKAYVTENFNVDRMTEQVEALYTSALAPR